MQAADEAPTTVIEVTDADFSETVVEESKTRPVVVDLWAEWCGPCRTLGPILERVAEERRGEFLLAKLDVDANPVTAASFGVQSIPTVIGFRDGKPVDGFIGAYPESAVREFVDGLLPTEADRVAAEASEEEKAGDVEGAEHRFREALAEDPDNRAARLGLADLLVGRGAHDEARELLMPLLPDAEVERLLATIEVREWSRIQGAGTLASAKHLAAQGNWRQALDGMLGALQDDPDARQAMLEVFAVLGDDDPLTVEYRRKLTNALF